MASSREVRGSMNKAAILLALSSAWLLPLHAADAPPPLYPDKENLLVCCDAEGEMRPVKTAADWSIRRDHIVKSLELVMGPPPLRWKDLPLDPQVHETVDLPKYTRKKVSFRAEPEDRVTAYLLLPRGAKGKSPAVLCLHQTTDTGKDEPAGLG